MKYLSIILVVFIFSCGNNESKSSKENIVKQIQLMEESRKFNNLAIQAMDKIADNSQDQSSFDITEESMASIAQFYKKALKEAEKVDVETLNEVHSDYGKMYTEKYIQSLKLRAKGLQPENYGEGAFVEGQILYDEFVEWETNMQNEMRKRMQNKKS